ncbi:energy-coupling factor ABC transporter ATP-binding protein [Methanonatronarchaeum sp. AMET6-2]|uniref:energy-coupling factor ABC transporter ATP-binding protein n=1 Tax=Methanonatronarchaeum sp. AMET6-2 TaxID=2933293 RepID=UPI00120FF8D3|nr:ATP-binding cassette domain-containing protein [Methanonatronarchaeum sp. AMET6-2]RZN61751.1 MAG: ATP-binding cassette domain-containing protein [Methanonatronarchaeia archaeon]UOY10091.1 ATP-binding cassette domain-containing protein [Methanonatronarchaeum sp. AMET6-2]
MNKALEIKNLHYRYEDGTKGLRGINLDVEKGESIALLGPNGAGKSTLLQCIPHVLQPTEGHIKVLGKKAMGNESWVRRKVSIVFQDPHDQLFMPTVFEDVAFGPLQLEICDKNSINEVVEEALKKVGLDGKEKKGSHDLSFGQKKRIAVATVLSMNPEVVLLDEPVSNLDPGARENMIELLQQIEKTKIIASNDIEMVLQTCEKAVILENGELKEQGPSTELLTDNQLLKKYGLRVPSIIKAMGKEGLKHLK